MNVDVSQWVLVLRTQRLRYEEIILVTSIKLVNNITQYYLYYMLIYVILFSIYYHIFVYILYVMSLQNNNVIGLTRMNKDYCIVLCRMIFYCKEM